VAFQPDILITTPDGRVMVIEAKVTMNDLAHTEEALKRYMVGMLFPFGLLITPTKGWVYQDVYSSFSPGSVKQVEEFDSSLLWREPPPDGPLQFEAYVQRWIEALPDYPAESLPPKLKDIVEAYVLPAVSIGEVRAAHPR
jgi:hypothetical protein